MTITGKKLINAFLIRNFYVPNFFVVNCRSYGEIIKDYVSAELLKKKHFDYLIYSNITIY